ncbi:hypothetical protein AeMF1_002218 [Aphanomyces euteiches]|nr:hypothetical protein AeMF1_002218 [Aphanomyces euteiches]KAH9192263.1 hypothetical protein AeNC1_005762 [Aphanomyces euteiches]
MAATTTSFPCRDSNQRLRALSVETMPPQFNLRPRSLSHNQGQTSTYSRYRAFRKSTTNVRVESPSFVGDPAAQVKETKEGAEMTAREESPEQIKQVQWSRTLSPLKAHPTYIDTESYEDLIFKIANLTPDSSRSVLLQVSDFLSRAATYLGYTFDVFPSNLDCSKLTSADIVAWQQLARYPWECEAEFEHLRTDRSGKLMDVTIVPGATRSLLQRLFNKPKGPRRMQLDSVTVRRLRCVQEVANTCLSFGHFQFTLVDIAQLCFAEF